MRPAQRFLIDIPDAWCMVDADGAALARSRARALATAYDPNERVRILDMFRQGAEVVRVAHAHGDLLSAGTASRSTGGLFMAYAAVAEMRVPPGQPVALSQLSARLGIRADAETSTEDRIVTSVDVPLVGRVQRITATEPAPLPGESGVRLLTMHTMMPVPEVSDSYFVVTLTSPNVPMKRSIYDLFDVITSTFRYPEEQAIQAHAPARF